MCSREPWDGRQTFYPAELSEDPLYYMEDDGELGSKSDALATRSETPIIHGCPPCHLRGRGSGRKPYGMLRC